MDLIHADANLVEIGFVKEIDSFDAELSQETDAEIQATVLTVLGAWEKLETISILILWGRNTDRIETNHAERCYRGMLYRKVIEPPDGQDYKVITSTEANAAILELVGTSFG